MSVLTKHLPLSSESDPLLSSVPDAVDDLQAQLSENAAERRREMAERLRVVRAHVTEATGRRREPLIEDEDLREPELMAVSKFQPVSAMRTAYDLGIRSFGENRPQEIRDKAADPTLTALPDWSMDCIGSVQRNKVKYLVGVCRCIQSIDRLDLAEAIHQRASQMDLVQDVLLQVNYSGEISKQGFAPQELAACLPRLLTLRHIRIRGLMGMAVQGKTYGELLDYFRSFADFFRELRVRFSAQGGEASAFTQLSLGMSEDFEAAIEAGSTCVRVGRAIFGARPLHGLHGA